MKLLPLLALVLPSAGLAQDCTPELTSAVGPFGAFGSTLAGEGRILAVGAPESDGAPGTVGNYPYGRVEVLEYDPNMPSWQPDGVLAPPPSPLTVVNNPGFGSAIAVGGDTILCGWPDDITGGNGTVRSFRRTNAGWVDEPPMLPPFASATGRFGVAVAINGDRCVVGEQLSGGLVHVFERAPATGEWTFLQTLASPAGINGTFGRSVALAGEWLFVGDPGHVGSLHGAGQLEVYRRSSTAWFHFQTIVAPGSNPLTADLFGFSLAFEENQRSFANEALYVGAPQEQGVGAVHELRFRFSPARWEHNQTLLGPAHLGAATFGWSVDQSGDALLVGAPQDSIGPAQTGAAYLFERDPVAGTFTSHGRFMLQGAMGTPQPQAGASVAVAGWHAAFGAPGAERVRVVPALPDRDVDADNATDACEARFQLATCWLLPNSTGSFGRIHVDGSVEVQAGNTQLAADQLPAQAFGYFLVSRVNQIILPPGGATQILCLGGPIGRLAGPGQILNSGSSGQVHLTIDPRQLPTPTGPVSAQPGETWYFQYWHRDSMHQPGVYTGFTEAARVQFE
jgi:hypothetical protein